MSDLTGDHLRRVLEPGEEYSHFECDDPLQPTKCAGGDPFVVTWWATEPRYFFLDLLGLSVGYAAPELREIARLRLRIPAETAAAEAVIRAARLTWRPGEFDQLAESGGFLLQQFDVFAPASAVSPAVVTILGNGFLRGDANADRKVDLSDAVSTLGYLFSGGDAPACLDAADADDSEAIEITDPIFLLGALFLGTKVVPAPFPGCGPDGAADDLGCGRSCDAR